PPQPLPSSHDPSLHARSRRVSRRNADDDSAGTSGLYTEGDGTTSGSCPRCTGRSNGTAHFTFRRYAPLIRFAAAPDSVDDHVGAVHQAGAFEGLTDLLGHAD